MAAEEEAWDEIDGMNKDDMVSSSCVWIVCSKRNLTMVPIVSNSRKQYTQHIELIWVYIASFDRSNEAPLHQVRFFSKKDSLQKI